MTFFQFLIFYLKATDADYLIKPKKHPFQKTICGSKYTVTPYNGTKKERNIVTVIFYILLFLIIGLEICYNFFGLFSPSANDVKAVSEIMYVFLPLLFVFIWLGLCSLNTSFLKIFMNYHLVYKKSSNVRDVLFNFNFMRHGSEIWRFSVLGNKYLKKVIPNYYFKCGSFLLNKIIVKGVINDKPITIIFKGKNVKICFKDELTVIEDTFNSPDELLSAVIEKLTQLKELDLIENPPLPPQNNSNKRKNKGKKKRK